MKKITIFLIGTLVSLSIYAQNIQTVIYETWASGNWEIQ